MRFIPIPLTLVLAAVLAVLIVTPAGAGEVIVVDGQGATRVQDPLVPTRSEISLGRPPGVHQPLAGAASAARSVGAPEAQSRPRADRRAVYRALARAARRDDAARSSVYAGWKRVYVRALRTYRRLRGARREQLGYVIDSVEALALSRRLTRTRMPVAFLQLRRNRQYWRAYPYPAVGDQVSFRGSEVLFQYFAGEGLQLHPLSTFKKANNMHGACEREESACDPARLRRLLDEMIGLAAQRSSKFIAWEYMFAFGGGSPPWISGMAEATAIQAFGRASVLLEEPGYLEVARSAMGAFETPPPLGVRTTGPRGGVHYLQYSFAPRLFIFNAFLQSLIGLHDFGRLAGDARATDLFRQAEPEAREEIPYSDVGDWSLYSYGGAESQVGYHELLREFLQSMCIRRLGPVYCELAERYRSYQVDPPELTYTGPLQATSKQPAAIRFNVSKLSVVELRVYRGTKLVFQRLATVRRGDRYFMWTPHAPGTVNVQLAAKELRTGLGKRDRAEGDIEVLPAP